MGCGCQKDKGKTFIWTSDDGQTSVIYTSEIAAKAKVMRKGGSYTPKEG